MFLINLRSKHETLTKRNEIPRGLTSKLQRVTKEEEEEEEEEEKRQKMEPLWQTFGN